MNYIKGKNLKLLLPLFLVVFGFYIFVSNTYFIQKVNAQFTSPANNPMETEYIQWKAYTVVRDCIRDTNIDLTNISGDEEAIASAMFLWHDGGRSGNVGAVYETTVGGGNEGSIDCDHLSGKLSIKHHVLEHLGFNSIRQFAQMLIDNGGKNRLTKQEAERAFNKYMRDNDLGGKGGNHWTLSDAAKYWYWMRVYRAGGSGELDLRNAKSDADNCVGILSNDATKGGTRVGDGSRKFYYFKQDSSGRWVPEDYTYAYYGLPTGVSLGGLDPFVNTSGQGGNHPTCSNIAYFGLNRSWRDAYVQRLNEFQEANPDAEIGGGGGGSVDVPLSCESEGGSMSWLLCSVLGLADEIVQGLDGALNSILLVPDELTDNSNLEQAWGRLRNLAYFILVPIVLIMVIGTALGFDFVSAYTVKRAMPRLVIAAIFIALSYDIAGFLVKMTNAVGTGLYGLITSAFAGSEAITLSSIFAPANGQGALGLGLVAGVGIAGLAVGSIGIILSYMLVAVASLAMGFFLLSLRQVMIVALMIMAPVAILAWIFPGNDKLWKLWWGTFSKLLLLFPLVMIVVASGRSFAYVIHAVSADDLTWVPMIHTLMKLVAYVGPFFFIPALFKFAGGVFATVAGITNDKSRGLFDRNRKYRQQKYGKNWGDFKAGQKKFRPKAFNRLGERVGVGAQGGFGFGERGKAALDTTRQARAEQAVRDNPQFQKFLQSDDDGSAVLGLSGSGSRREIDAAKADLRNHWVGEERRKALEAGETWDDAREMRAQAAASVRADQAEARARAIGFNRTNAEAAYYGMAQNKARALEGEDAMDVIARGAERLGGGNERHAESARQGFMFHARGNGRADIGGNDFDDAWSRQSIGAIVGGDARAMKNFQRQIQADWSSGDTTRMQKAATRIAELHGALPGATDNNAEIINELLNDTVQYDTSKPIGLEDQLAGEINRRAAGLAPGQIGPAPEIITGEYIAKHARKYSKDTTDAERLRYEQESLARRAGMGGNNPFGGP